MAKLTFVLEEGQEVVVPLVDAVTLTLGRGDDNDVVVDDARVSTHHAALERNADGSIELRDLNSSAGTFVNGERVQSRCIHDGDTLAFGPLTAVFDLEEQTRTNGHAPNGGPSRLIRSERGSAAPQPDAELDRLEEEKERLNDSVATLQAEVSECRAEKERLQNEIASAQTKLQSWQERAAREMREHTVRMDTLHADEKRLAQVKGAVLEAEALHQQWVDAVKTLSAEHEETSTDVERLIAAEASTRHEIEALTLHKDEALAHLQQVREECERDDAHLEALRLQVATLEERHKRVEELAVAREDQVKLAEKKLADVADHRARLEAHIKELAGTEQKLVKAMERCREAEAGHVGLIAAIAALETEKQRLEGVVKGAESRVHALEEQQKKISTASAESEASRQRTEEALRTLQSEIKTRQDELAAAVKQLQETRTQRAEIARQCEELAGTETKLASVLHQFSLAEERHEELTQGIAGAEARLTALSGSITTLQGKEDAAKGRLEVLHGRENDLRSELGKLSTAEQESRARFEELRELISQAEQEHQSRLDEHGVKARACHQELHELESKLAPFRDWKEAMDQLYARLGELPQDSSEARDLWREIEKEKEDLESLISTARTQAREVSVKTVKKPAGAARTAPQAVVESLDKALVEEPMHVEVHVSGSGNSNGHANGNGHSHGHGLNGIHGAATAASLVQERTLKARLNHLRESVQREESRLEFLRHERGRHEVRARTSGPAGDAMQREHDRHLEAKIRHDEEHLNALHHKVELAKGEEEKRRAKIVEMEHRMAELHAGITEAERHRSELRHQADLAHTELKNFEATHERLKKAAEDEAAMEKEMATAWGPGAKGKN
ncbi:MAG: FHA domain-containing protein [Prosthecobacter sp.]